MDASVPHPPIDHAIFIFLSFTRIYFTTSHPIDFINTLTPEQIIVNFQKLSLQARQLLHHIYTLLKHLIVAHPVQQQMLESAYLYAVQMIHVKFGTRSTDSPFIYPTR
jgi:hypothetical protein